MVGENFGLENALLEQAAACMNNILVHSSPFSFVTVGGPLLNWVVIKYYLCKQKGQTIIELQASVPGPTS